MSLTDAFKSMKLHTADPETQILVSEQDFHTLVGDAVHDVSHGECSVGGVRVISSVLVPAGQVFMMDMTPQPPGITRWVPLGTATDVMATCSVQPTFKDEEPEIPVELDDQELMLQERNW